MVLEHSCAVRLEVDEGVGTIRLDRPPLNVLDRAGQSALRQAAEDASADPGVRAVVLSGGRNAFSAGADIKEIVKLSYVDMISYSEGLEAAFTAVASIGKPVVAAINGPALGGGCELALAADFRICATDSRLGLPEIELGVMPGAGGTQRLPRLIGIAMAKDLIFSGRSVDAAEALSLGLVNQVVAPDQVLPTASSWAGRFRHAPALALRAIKAAIDRGMATDLASGIEIERSLFAGLFATEDRDTGMRTFVTEGPGRAVFSGR
jgi:enoyl-CoA hydratase/carnithine racemase